MAPHNEDEAEILIEEHLRSRGWDLADFTITRKRWRDLDMISVPKTATELEGTFKFSEPVEAE